MVWSSKSMFLIQQRKKRNVLQPTPEIDLDKELFDNAGFKPSDVVYDKLPIMT
jgi:hypothetical protein